MPDPLLPTGHGGSDDDPVERTLRRTLADEASAVDPGPAPRVGAVPGRPPSARPRRWPAALGVAAAVGALAVASAVALRPDDAPAPVAAPSTSPTATPSASAEPFAPSDEPSTPSEAPVATPSVSRSDEASEPWAAVPVLVWSVVDQSTPTGSTLTVTPDRALADVVPEADLDDPSVVVAAAVQHLLSSPSPDPDAVNLWSGPGRTALTTPPPVVITPDGTTVDLPGAAFRGSLGSEAAAAALSTLVRTVVSNGGIAPVTVLVDGQEGAEVWGVLALDSALSPTTQDLAGGWILDPYEGQRVAAGTVTLSGTATAFEATVLWAVLDADGATVEDGFTMAGSNGEYGPWSVPVDLGPGTYTALLRAPDMAGAEESGGRDHVWEDSTTFTVVP